MKTVISTKVKGLFATAGLAFLSFTGMAQEHITVSVENITHTATTIEYDVYVVNDGSTAIKLSGCAFGLNYNPAILNGAVPSQSAHSFAQGTRAKSLSLTEFSLLNTNRDNQNQLRMTTKTVRRAEASDLTANVPFKVGHFKFINTKPWAPNSNPSFALNEFNVPGISTTCATGYVDASTNPIGFSTAKKNLSVKIVNSPVLNPSKGSEAAVTLQQEMNASANALEQTSRTALTEATKINVYPNPTQDILHVAFAATEVENVLVKVMDLRGRVVKQIQANSEKGNNNLTVSLREVPSGVYTVQVYQNNNLSLTEKVTKNN